MADPAATSNTGMKIGVTIFATAYSMAPAELGPALEERGIESVWIPEHSHIPASRESPWPGGPDLPQFYYDTMDPLVVLSAIAATTSRLRLATGIALVMQRDPIYLAKEIASLDQISGGRFILGIGAGWNMEEMADHGTDPARRFGRMRETIEAMQAIWGAEVAEYHGEQIDFDPLYSNPKPVQPGGPPVHVGGVHPGGMRRAVAYGDGWVPIGGRLDVETFTRQLAEVDDALSEAGRDRASFEVSAFGVAPKKEQLERLGQAGANRAVIGLPSTDREDLLPRLDKIAALING